MYDVFVLQVYLACKYLLSCRSTAAALCCYTAVAVAVNSCCLLLLFVIECLIAKIVAVVH